MHRNTYILVGILAVLAALVVGVNVGRKISPATAPVTPTPQPTVDQPLAGTPTASLQTFTDSECGFSLMYGSAFTLMNNASGSAILNFANDKNKSVIMACQKDIPRPPLPANKIESLTLPTTTGASVSAKLYHDQSAQNGTPIDALIFTHPTSKLDVFVAGYGSDYDTVLKTIRIIP
jgi:hypothetical protein